MGLDFASSFSLHVWHAQLHVPVRYVTTALSTGSRINDYYLYAAHMSMPKARLLIKDCGCYLFSSPATSSLYSAAVSRLSSSDGSLISTTAIHPLP